MTKISKFGAKALALFLFVSIYIVTPMLSLAMMNPARATSAGQAICHSGNAKNWEYIAPNDNSSHIPGANGHTYDYIYSGPQVVGNFKKKDAS